MWFKQIPIEYLKSSKKKVKIFDKQDFIKKYDKNRKELKRIKNSDKIAEKLYLSNVTEIQVKLKQERKKLNKTINKFEINETPLPEGGETGGGRFITASGNILASGIISLNLFKASLETIELLIFW